MCWTLNEADGFVFFSKLIHKQCRRSCNVKKLTSSYCTTSSPHTKYFPIQPSHSINKQSLLKPLCRTQSHKNIWPSYSSWKVSKMFSHSHEIQNDHILKINKTKGKKLNQIHIFSLSNLLIKLLILQKYT